MACSACCRTSPRNSHSAAEPTTAALKRWPRWGCTPKPPKISATASVHVEQHRLAAAAVAGRLACHCRHRATRLCHEGVALESGQNRTLRSALSLSLDGTLDGILQEREVAQLALRLILPIPQKSKKTPQPPMKSGGDAPLTGPHFCGATARRGGFSSSRFPN